MHTLNSDVYKLLSLLSLLPRLLTCLLAGVEASGWRDADNINDLQWWETPGWVTWYYLKKPWDWRLRSLPGVPKKWKCKSSCSIVPCNLGICAILDCAAHSQNPETVCQSRSCAANLEIVQYVHLRNLKTA